ncbi:MAG: class I SAM-dependent methyltransferase [Dehalococcoidia bacterium]
MNLIDVVNRTTPPTAWAEGDNIPWDQPEFSERMLAEHLRQDSDAASRRLEKIDEQVAWIHRTVLRSRPARILDLACGPGLYTTRLARLGHTAHGIDFAPAAVRYARESAISERAACSYELADLRTAAFGSGFGLVMMLYGQLNVFRRAEAPSILERAFDALDPGGTLLIEPQRLATVIGDGTARRSWYAAREGLFSPRPHLCLVEESWDERVRAATVRWYVVDAESGEVTRHALTNEAYSDDQYVALLEGIGCAEVELHLSLIGVDDPSQSANVVVIGRKPLSGHATGA